MGCFVSLSSGEEEEGDEEDSTARTPKQLSKEEEEEEQLNRTLAEMKAQEVAELKRCREQGRVWGTVPPPPHKVSVCGDRGRE